jgi:hypothetical protein
MSYNLLAFLLRLRLSLWVNILAPVQALLVKVVIKEKENLFPKEIEQDFNY